LPRQHFTFDGERSVIDMCRGLEGEISMEETFGNWRNAAVGLGLTIIVIGTALALAFL
jgi:hypothetical protein